ncbi:hypothetical protein M5K25_009578 [Dendrobium thyrsiflorum]|uniref:Uncharacterized protein n=1 Tax=Dendrobium thyrsiflorum TaxID=117978 RepID=A0ABD0V5T7_DENTH
MDSYFKWYNISEARKVRFAEMKLTDLHLVIATLTICVSYRDGELSTRDLQKMVQALPQYSEQIDKLSLHVESTQLKEKFYKPVFSPWMADPERDFGFIYNDQGFVNILRLPFFDLNPEVDDSVKEYVERIIFTLSNAIKEQLSTVQ